MRFFILVLLQFLILLPLTGYAAPAPQVKAKALQKAAIVKSYGKLPLYFIRNEGQTDSSVKYYERGGRHATFFTDDGLVLSLVKDKRARAVSISFVGANKDLEPIASGALETRVNYLTGKNKKAWRSDIPVYGSVMYKGVYSNVDISFYGNNNNRIEHDIIVKPGGNPAEVVFSYDGVKSIDVTKAGDLEISLSDGMILEKKPYIYQEIDGKRVRVEGSYRIINHGSDSAASYGFNVASYDHSRALVIDPTLTYSTYLGGSSPDFSRDIAIDNTGAVYITGWTMSANFPTVGPAQGVFSGGLITGDAFVTKINSAGTAVVFSTYLGGSRDEDSLAVAVDASGAVYVTGDTESFNFPVINAFQGSFGGGIKDGFVAKLNPAGNAFVFSTYLGGFADEKSKDIAVDNSGAIYLTGWTASHDFPIVNPIQSFLAGIKDAFVVKMASTGRSLIYSTFIGGTDIDGGRALALDATGAVYVAGHSWSVNFPLKNPIQGTFGGIKDVVVFKINSAGSALVFSTYIGGAAAEKSKGIALDSVGSIFVTGWTASADFPVVNPLQGVLRGLQDAFVFKLAPPGRRIIFSTYLGGNASDSGRDIAVDSANNVYVVGHTWSSNFPRMTPLQGTFGGIRDGFVTRINGSGSKNLFSTYLGGSGNDTARGVVLDSSDTVYLTGGTNSLNFPVINPIQARSAGSNDAFIAKIGAGGGGSVTVSITPDITTVPKGGSFGYTITTTNSAATRQCVDFWENVTLPNGKTYPRTGALLGPMNMCTNANASKATHFTQAVPLKAPSGAYSFNAFIGTPYPNVGGSASFNLNITAPVPGPAYHTWKVIENGFRK